MFKSSSHLRQLQAQHRALAALLSPRRCLKLYTRRNCSAAPSAASHSAAAPAGQAATDEHYMRLAMEQAHEAADAGEVPVGAVLVSGAGAVLAAERNRCEHDADPTSHAEMLCIRQAAARQQGWRLLDSTLYVTLEPCPMCAGALLQARVGAVVYGARNSLLGADGSWISMLPRGVSVDEASCRGNGSNAAAAAQPQRPHPFHAGMLVRRGVLEAESAALMRAFFKRRREEGSQRGVGPAAADAET